MCPLHSYNEVVLNGYSYSDHLPNIIEAIFYPVNGHVDTKEGDANQARSIYQHFLSRYGLPPLRVPFLTFDVKAAENGLPPFRDAT